MDIKPYDKNFSLQDRVAFITGAAAGIGRAIAGLYYEKGAKLVLFDRNEDVSAIAAQIAPDAPPASPASRASRILAISGDATSAAARDSAVAAAIGHFGRIDILVNCAGIGLLDPAIDVTEARWDLTLDLNLKALFFLSQAVARHMIPQGGGRIINLASQAGIVALDRHVAYMASKAAIIGITKVLALEWTPHNIQTNAISPTVVLTELGRKAWAGDVGEAFRKKLPAGRFAYPEEIAACALFLASDAAAMITGANLVIDGGYTIQ
ncbi:MAG: D-threitol dehydrogenase [Opitutaceae bacterium]|jgi:NAD(P)-dependent dehydrogenase (short-subunit alcohol dehydrogenase family)|nr:D-threitol dehydrogenase [Opitutaceae bacterium]